MIFLTRLKPKLPAQGAGIRFAIYQGERPVGTPAALQDNLAKLDEIVREAKKYDVQLISFPELYLEGYTLTPALVQQLAEPVDGPSISRVAAMARTYHISIICPYAERDDRGGEARYYDAIAVLGADGTLLHNYRKTHLFGAAERINDTFGYAEGTEDPFRVPLVAGFPVGVLNCYEAEFPELSRILALRGAKLIVIPTAADYYYTLPDGRRTKMPYPDVTHTLIPVMDTHAAGEPTRIVLSGLPPILGATMAAKKQFMRDHLDHFRTLLMHEPRGHRDMFGAVLTPPTTPRGQYGLLFMDNAWYLDMCGHGTMSVTTVLIETGMIPPTEPETVVVFDTPAGVVEGRARVEGQHVYEVSVANVPSFLYARDVPIELPDVGTVPVDVAFGGNFFALVQARALGTSAAMAARYARGTLPLGVAYTSESIIGTRFTGHLVREVRLGEYMAVQPVVTGEAYITGIQQFVVDPRDPVKYGFSVGKSAQR